MRVFGRGSGAEDTSLRAEADTDGESTAARWQRKTAIEDGGEGKDGGLELGG